MNGSGRIVSALMPRHGASGVRLEVGEGRSRSLGAAGGSMKRAGTAPGCANRRPALSGSLSAMKWGRGYGERWRN